MRRILLTNDDGIRSEGLLHLEEQLKAVGDVYVVAPLSEMSGASHSLTLNRPLRIQQFDARHWAIDGTPTDCVTLALYQILPADEWPEICASGINHGGNLGDDATYSGTVAGALEAAILGVPGLAFSLVARDTFDFDAAARYAAKLVAQAMDRRLPPDTMLNVNIPAGRIAGTRVTRQGLKTAKPVVTQNTDPRGKAYYWIGERDLETHHVPGTDYWAIEHAFASITPMRVDMTNRRALQQMKEWNIDHDAGQP